jgi:chitin synthase
MPFPSEQSVRQVPLQNGNLVFDVQVPSHIVTSSEKSEEFTKMRVSRAVVSYAASPT